MEEEAPRVSIIFYFGSSQNERVWQKNCFEFRDLQLIILGLSLLHQIKIEGNNILEKHPTINYLRGGKAPQH